MKSFQCLLLLLTLNGVIGFLVSRSSHDGTVMEKSSSKLFYSPDDDKFKGSSGDSPFDQVVWKSLRDTERWIESTLGSFSNTNGDTDNKGKLTNNPYARKEVSYVCETTSDVTEFVARIFGRLKEIRQLGDTHGKNEMRLGIELGDEHTPRIFRQTLVCVTPSVTSLSESFNVFDDVVNAINEARRNSRDYVIGVDNKSSDTWITSVNMAHLHPLFGFDEEDPSNSEDPKVTAYKKKRMEARRSPYPTCVIEVRATPPMPIESTKSKTSRRKRMQKVDKEEDASSREQLRKLEALFGKSAEKESSSNAEESFYDSIGKTKGIETLTFVTPQDEGRNWVVDNVVGFDSRTSAFGFSDVNEVDEAHEYVFSHIAMDYHKFVISGDAGSSRNRSYLIMPHFLKSSATSFDRFSKAITNIVSKIPDLGHHLKISTFHREHVEKERRSPVPIFVLEWH